MAQTMAESLMAQGWKEGLSQGKTTGELKTAREFLRIALETKFGAVPEQLLTQINSVTDMDKLRQLFRQALELAKLEDCHF